MIYVAATLLSCLFAFLAGRVRFVPLKGSLRSGETYKNKFSQFFVVASVLPLFLLSTFRRGIGVDYGLYEQMFFYATQGRDYYRYYDAEWLYLFLNQIVAFVSSNVVAIFAVTSLIVAVGVYYSIFKLSPIPWLSVFLYVGTTSFFLSLNITRQAMVVAIILMALKYIEAERFVPYLVVVFFCSGIHSASWFMLAFYFIPKVKLTPQRSIISLGIIAVALPFLNNLFVRVIALTRYSVYLTSEVWSNPQFQALQFVIHASILLFYCLFFRNNIHDRRFKVLFSIQYLAVIACLLSNYIPLMYRIINFFMFFPILGIPIVIVKIKNQKMKIWITLAVLLCFSVYAYVDIVLRGNQGVFPYQSVFM